MLELFAQLRQSREHIIGLVVAEIGARLRLGW
jgi:hypothetical protein